MLGHSLDLQVSRTQRQTSGQRINGYKKKKGTGGSRFQESISKEIERKDVNRLKPRKGRQQQ